ncbi:MAG: PEP/pyruvate-binding domain-containing protein, partial [Thermoanaerobaculia bacterium]
LGTVRYTFAEPLVRYSALEPKAVGFVDDLLRGSALLPLAQVASALAQDAANLAGLTHVVFGSRVGGLVGLNPGAAVGRLRLVGEEELTGRAPLRDDEIVVLPRTVTELTPVAGIITLAEGSVLSHVQLLARNLGIPNVVATPNLAPRMAPFHGLEVVLAVGSDGSVVLERLDRLPEAARARLRQASEPDSGVPAAKLEVPAPDLGLRRPLRLSELHAGLSGKVVGPKAANVGELARQFPGRVAPAVALPFGIFAEHAAAGPEAPKARIDRACERYREGDIDDTTLATEIETARLAIADLTLSDATREQLLALMSEVFGPPGTYGVFVRSDTNLEDLPGFTGAGLNKTVPHVVDLDKILDAIPDVWSSPFTFRAVAWRERTLTRPGDVYPSVLLMQSVPVAKSGVLVTADLVSGAKGLTVATAWGVGGAVEGESAETLVLHPEGSYSLVAEAKAPYARRLRPEGGVEWIPAQAGPVLTEAEQRALGALATDARARLEPVPGTDGSPLPWDIEFGFLNGRLYLFQVRPLVERGGSRADEMIQALGAAPRGSVGRVPLDAAVGSRVAAGALGR